MDHLKTDYKNDKWTGMRKYQMTDNTDGTISLNDVTQYTDVGDIYSAADINATNAAVNGFYDEYAAKVQKIENVINISLPAANWSGSAPYTQTVAVGTIRASDTPIPGLLYPNSMTESQKAQIDKSVNMITEIETLNGAVKVTCKFKRPVADMIISLKGVV